MTVTEVAGVKFSTCMKCGTRTYSPRFGTWLHEANQQIRCPTVQPNCNVCDQAPVVQCRYAGCLMLFHPGCGGKCTCCGADSCPKHISPAGICLSCGFAKRMGGGG